MTRPSVYTVSFC